MRQLARMHHHKPECLRDDAPIAVLDLDLPDHALPMPAARRFVLRPPRLFPSERQRGLLLAPGCQFLTHGTGPGH
ncbi:MAG: hypothetical protein HRJ53_16560 [Acidobacteria bacterium Pan2503]|uniref:Uncharacterized protein n=1 Tax=Candidatus Acidiferrum panamense TaxID=2741543 RepID=A0A7V8SY25_9BACT|nr:hypothetical protein [Candidatus Acidoferrum panamensis]